MQRFLQQFQPLVGVLMETEVWPNLVAGCQRAGVPLVLTNARLNAQSFAGAKRWSALSRPAYAALAAVLAQTTQDAERLRQLGCAAALGVGQFRKFDVQPDPALLALGASWRSASRRPRAAAGQLARGRGSPVAAGLAQHRRPPSKCNG